MITFSYGRLPSNGNYVPLWSFCDRYESPLPVCKARLRCTTQNFYKQGWLTEVTWGHFDMMARLRRWRGTSLLLKQPRYYNACAVKDSRFQTLHHFAYISGCVEILTSPVCNGSWGCFCLLVWRNWVPASTSDGGSITHFKENTQPELPSPSFTSN